jgi:ParB family chromosome partitioning protein
MSQDKKKKKSKALGKGLEALLPRKPAATPGNGKATAAQVQQATVQEIVEKVQESATEAAAAGGTAQLAEVSEKEALVALADATGLKPDNVSSSAEMIERRWGKDFVTEHKIKPGEMVIQLPVNLLERNPYQTRFTGAEDPGLADLAESIKVHGVMQPVLVCPLKQPGPQGELYHLIAGERRWLASKMAGRTHIPAIVRDLASHDVLVLTIIENLHRQDLSPMQHARAFHRLMDEFHFTQEEVAQRTGMPRSAVANYLRLRRLPDFAQKAIEEGRLLFGHAKVLMTLGSPEAVELCTKKVMANRLSVRETEMLVDEFLNPPAAPEKAERKVDPNVRAAELELERALGCRVRIKDRNGRGKIQIEYRTLEDFDRVITSLK